MESIQLGISVAISGLASKPERDLLMKDFMMVETVPFPKTGSQTTPAHRYAEFKFKTYAPIAFRHFRALFGIKTDDYLLSVGSTQNQLRELTNPGASGSVFYLTHDDQFIIKTVQPKEAEFLLKLLPQYYMNLRQNPRTLLPKFFGQYCYICGGKNIRLIIMNNLLPSTVKMHQKYDLKGSTYKRKASSHERSKASPTFKDLDFMEHHKEGFTLEPAIYDALMKTIAADLRVLESFKIMDFSLLVGVHNLDIAQDTVPIEPINIETLKETDSWGAIPAKNVKGENLLLFMGIIDILQSYRFKKKLEHTFKSMIHDGDSISVHKPSYYCKRFQEFMATRVLRPANSSTSATTTTEPPTTTAPYTPTNSATLNANNITNSNATSNNNSNTPTKSPVKNAKRRTVQTDL